MTSKEKLQALLKMIEADDKCKWDISEIKFTKDGRLLVWHDGDIRQVPEWKLKEML
jgi:hypothetical protein